MTPQDFQNWRARMGWTQPQAAEALGVTRGAVQNYERGHRPGADPRPVEIPKPVALACVALSLGYDGYEAVEEKPRR